MDQTGNVRQQMDLELTAELQQISTPSDALLHSRLTRFSFQFNEALDLHGSFFFSSNKQLSNCKWTTLLPEPTKKIDTARQISTYQLVIMLCDVICLTILCGPIA